MNIITANWGRNINNSTNRKRKTIMKTKTAQMGLTKKETQCIASLEPDKRWAIIKDLRLCIKQIKALNGA